MANNDMHPVVQAWEQVRWIVERGGCGELVLWRSKSQEDGDLTRKDLLINKDIIGPILNHMGNLFTSDCFLVQSV